MFGLRWPLPWRRRPRQSLAQRNFSTLYAAVWTRFIAQAEADFGPDWQRHMRRMSGRRRNRWIARHFPDHL